MIRILLVEDSEADVVLMQEALREAELDHVLDLAEDGARALAALRGPDPLPDLVLLDLNMPRKDGREVLAEVKTDPALLHVPVVVLTTSQSPSDVAFAYSHHANAYIRKPSDLGHLMAVAQAIADFWGHAVTLPGALP